MNSKAVIQTHCERCMQMGGQLFPQKRNMMRKNITKLSNQFEFGNNNVHCAQSPVNNPALGHRMSFIFKLLMSSVGEKQSLRKINSSISAMYDIFFLFTLGSTLFFMNFNRTWNSAPIALSVDCKFFSVNGNRLEGSVVCRLWSICEAQSSKQTR